MLVRLNWFSNIYLGFVVMVAAAVYVGLGRAKIKSE